MRTTIVIQPHLEGFIQRLSGKKALSRFINRLIENFLKKEQQKKMEKKLETAYKRANKENEAVSKEFESIDLEGWPE